MKDQAQQPIFDRKNTGIPETWLCILGVKSGVPPPYRGTVLLATDPPFGDGAPPGCERVAGKKSADMHSCRMTQAGGE